MNKCVETECFYLVYFSQNSGYNEHTFFKIELWVIAP